MTLNPAMNSSSRCFLSRSNSILMLFLSVVMVSSSFRRDWWSSSWKDETNRLDSVCAGSKNTSEKGMMWFCSFCIPFSCIPQLQPYWVSSVWVSPPTLWSHTPQTACQHCPAPPHSTPSLHPLPGSASWSGSERSRENEIITHWSSLVGMTLLSFESQKKGELCLPD